MSTDYRALCAELADDYWPCHYQPELLDRARAALAQPEPVAPTDEEIEKWADAAKEVPLEIDLDVRGWGRCFTAKEFNETIRAAIAYWGTPANNTREEN
jgi:hypothetical protein